MTQWKGLFSMATAALLVLASCSGCDRGDGARKTLKVTGSDTMLDLAQAWSEAYRQKHPDVSLQVKGGGSGVGIKALSEGKVDIANASRKMKDKEIEDAEKNTGKKPREFQVAIDALAIITHKDNPIEAISVPELAEIYGEGAKATKWTDLGIDNTACKDGEIVPFGRHSSSGTYLYFKEALVGEKGEYRKGIVEQSGSSEVVEVISTTPCGIGYVGMGYVKDVDKVKVVHVAKEKGVDAVEPSIATATDGRYPIARPLFIYTLGDPSPAVQAYIDWILSDEGQKVVADMGYIPLPKGSNSSSK
jgi:phosphate transport system substrate-binding protein